MKETKFESEPFSEEIWQIKQMESPLIARALSRDITMEFLAMLRFKIDHNELINIDCVGRPRSGKSYGTYALCKIIAAYTHVPFTLLNVLQRQSDYLGIFRTGKTHEIFQVDEYEVGEMQIGSQAEYYQEVDVMRIAAKRVLHRVNLCGEETLINTNAEYILVSHSRDFSNWQTKFVVYKKERGQEIAMGYIIIPLSSILCEEMLSHRQKGCLGCPFYDTDECQREFPKGYEKKKDANIKRVTEENFNWRSKMRIDVAEKLAKNEHFTSLKKGDQLIYARNLAPSFTNRTLTEKELDEVCRIARMIARQPEIVNEMKAGQVSKIPLGNEETSEDEAGEGKEL
jgi:hypothetical protein